MGPTNHKYTYTQPFDSQRKTTVHWAANIKDPIQKQATREVLILNSIYHVNWSRSDKWRKSREKNQYTILPGTSATSTHQGSHIKQSQTDAYVFCILKIPASEGPLKGESHTAQRPSAYSGRGKGERINDTQTLPKIEPSSSILSPVSQFTYFVCKIKQQPGSEMLVGVFLSTKKKNCRQAD